jgi:hypothetical protein
MCVIRVVAPNPCLNLHLLVSYFSTMLIFTIAGVYLCAFIFPTTKFRKDILSSPSEQAALP